MWLWWLAALVAVGVGKDLPFGYCLRTLFYGVYDTYFSGLRCNLLGEGFVSEHWVWPSDLDYNMHMNNSVYFREADYARTRAAVTTGIWKFIRKLGYRMANGGIHQHPLLFRLLPVVSHSRSINHCCLGATMHFRREMRLFQRYSLSCRLQCFDKKWMAFEHAYKNPEDGSYFANGFVRLVVKDGRRTVPPAEILGGMIDAGLAQLPDGVKSLDELRVDSIDTAFQFFTEQ
eukprot:TRINITY_DN53621_c0_g1_i2.p2 TRINITY_DN53621_c0_g1~~TRINITY_DN53621_c0_g1_i2.p2  ORF type:complete len:231 (+),score=65.77 TRINITY_DN53621_c0_g1_i2:138-830(+)